jgi:hypothetical protein
VQWDGVNRVCNGVHCVLFQSICCNAKGHIEATV